MTIPFHIECNKAISLCVEAPHANVQSIVIEEHPEFRSLRVWHILLGFLLKKLTGRLGQEPWFVNEMAVDVWSPVDAHCLYGGPTSKCALAFGRDR